MKYELSAKSPMIEIVLFILIALEFVSILMGNILFGTLAIIITGVVLYKYKSGGFSANVTVKKKRKSK